jgi:hypothetical protein
LVFVEQRNTAYFDTKTSCGNSIVPRKSAE